MQSLDEKEWREFDFAEIFDIKKGFYNKKPEDSGNGTIPFLGATDSNNGVTRFLTLDEIANSTKTGVLPNFPLDKKLFPGHAIAVTNNGSVGHAYYQATPFTCSHDINPLYLRDHEMSRDEADFLIKAIEEQGKLFQYARKWRPIRMVKSKLMLPVTDSGEPDYAYMAEYAQQKRDTMLAKYRAYNGLKGFVHNPKKIIAGQCITLNNDGDGGAGLAYYQPANMALDSHVTALVPLIDMSAFVMLFIAKCISGLHGFFGHGLSISNPRAKRLRIMLPVTDSGEPDYKYMEQYSKNMMLRKYRQYLTFAQQ